MIPDNHQSIYVTFCQHAEKYPRHFFSWQYFQAPPGGSWGIPNSSSEFLVSSEMVVAIKPPKKGGQEAS